MKKLSTIIFLIIMLVGVVGYADRLHNDYLDPSAAVETPIAEAVLSARSHVAKDAKPLQSMTFAILFGTGLVGMVIIRRK